MQYNICTIYVDLQVFMALFETVAGFGFEPVILRKLRVFYFIMSIQQSWHLDWLPSPIYREAQVYFVEAGKPVYVDILISCRIGFKQ